MSLLLFFFFNDTATTEIYTLSLHDALPISLQTAVEPGTQILERCRQSSGGRRRSEISVRDDDVRKFRIGDGRQRDRKSTRLNSSHQIISYAVFCLKKKKKNNTPHAQPDTSS